MRDWSEEGCETDTDDALLGETGVTCSCDHLTSFAVLMVCLLIYTALHCPFTLISDSFPSGLTHTET